MLATGGTADRRPAVDPTALPMRALDEQTLVSPWANRRPRLFTGPANAGPPATPLCICCTGVDAYTPRILSFGYNYNAKMRTHK